MPTVDKVGLPIFTYHPNPLATGSVTARAGRCECCGQDRGYVYTAPVTSSQIITDEICPWCIADGSAAAKFDATFSDDQSLLKAGVPEAIIEEITQRTPGYNTWGRDEWRACCDDACVFHGHAPRSLLAVLDPTAVEQFLSTTGWSPEEWHAFVANYEPGGNPAVHHFVCRSCQKSKYGWDTN